MKVLDQSGSKSNEQLKLLSLFKPSEPASLTAKLYNLNPLKAVLDGLSPTIRPSFVKKNHSRLVVQATLFALSEANALIASAVVDSTFFNWKVTFTNPKPFNFGIPLIVVLSLPPSFKGSLFGMMKLDNQGLINSLVLSVAESNGVMVAASKTVAVVKAVAPDIRRMPIF